jgi:hypothetical protein
MGDEERTIKALDLDGSGRQQFVGGSAPRPGVARVPMIAAIGIAERNGQKAMRSQDRSLLVSPS